MTASAKNFRRTFMTMEPLRRASVVQACDFIEAARGLYIATAKTELRNSDEAPRLFAILKDMGYPLSWIEHGEDILKGNGE